MLPVWKKLACLCLPGMLFLGSFAGCSGKPAETTGSTAAETTEATEVTEPAEEAKTLKVLTLGHSLAVDTNHMLNLVADIEGIGDYEEVVIGTLYYSGCRLSQHVSFIRSGEAAYSLYLSSTATPERPPEILNDFTMEMALRHDYWDIIVMMGNRWELLAENGYTNGNIQTIQSYVNEKKLNPLAYFAWHAPWAAPTDEELLDMYPYEPNPNKVNYQKYGNSRETLFEAMCQGVADHIMTDETFRFVIPTGTAMQNAWSSYLTEKDLHRDYGHATDMARAMTAYVWYCKLMGIEQLEEIQLDVIPKAFLKSTADKTQGRVLTEAEKAIMLESINNALKNPLEMTQSQYTEKP